MTDLQAQVAAFKEWRESSPEAPASFHGNDPEPIDEDEEQTHDVVLERARRAMATIDSLRDRSPDMVNGLYQPLAPFAGDSMPKPKPKVQPETQEQTAHTPDSQPVTLASEDPEPVQPFTEAEAAFIGSISGKPKVEPHYTSRNGRRMPYVVLEEDDVVEWQTLHPWEERHPLMKAMIDEGKRVVIPDRTSQDLAYLYAAVKRRQKRYGADRYTLHMAAGTAYSQGEVWRGTIAWVDVEDGTWEEDTDDVEA